MPPRPRMAQRIRDERRRRKWRQGDLAKRAGITRPYLVRLEAGKQDPRVSVVLRIAKALGVKVGKLIDQ